MKKGIKSELNSYLVLYAAIPFAICLLLICIFLSGNEWQEIYSEAKNVCKTHSEHTNARLEFILKNSDSIVSDKFISEQFDRDYGIENNDSIPALFEVEKYLSLFTDSFSSSIADIVIYHNNYTLYQSKNSKYIEELDELLIQKVLDMKSNETMWVNRDGYSTAYRNCSTDKHIIILANKTFINVENLTVSSNIKSNIELISKDEFNNIDENIDFISYNLLNSQVLILMINNSVRNRCYIKYIIIYSILFILFLCIIYVFSKRISNKLTKNLYEFINLISSDADYQNIAKLDIEKTDELYPVYHRIMKLIEDINSFYAEIDKLNKENSRLELMHMQMQINPHLLYNSLSVLKWDCMKYGDDITEKIDLLVDYYRLSILPLYSDYYFENELELIEKYIQIISIIHNYNYKYTIEFDEELKKQKTIQHIFQPMVENSILHGINGKPDGKILLKGKMNINEILIEISDNGFGMNESVLQRINNFETDLGPHFGIKNTFRRLKFFYGDNCHIEVKSHKDEGTRIFIKINLM